MGLFTCIGAITVSIDRSDNKPVSRMNDNVIESRQLVLAAVIAFVSFSSRGFRGIILRGFREMYNRGMCDKMTAQSTIFSRSFGDFEG